MDEDDYELVTVANTHVLPPATRDNLSTAATTNPIEVMQEKPQSTGKSRAMMLVALIATIAIMVLAIIVILVIFSPQSSGSTSDIEAIKQQIDSLRMTVSQIQQSNLTFGTEISRQTIQELEYEFKSVINATQAQLNTSASLTEVLYQRLSRAEAHINSTLTFNLHVHKNRFAN